MKRIEALRIFEFEEASSPSDEEINKKYRQLSLKYHPDRHPGLSEEEKKKQNDKMQEINFAREVLTKQEEKLEKEFGEKYKEEKHWDLIEKLNVLFPTTELEYHFHLASILVPSSELVTINNRGIREIFLFHLFIKKFFTYGDNLFDKRCFLFKLTSYQGALFLSSSIVKESCFPLCLKKNHFFISEKEGKVIIKTKEKYKEKKIIFTISEYNNCSFGFNKLLYQQKFSKHFVEGKINELKKFISGLEKKKNNFVFDEKILAENYNDFLLSLESSKKKYEFLLSDNEKWLISKMFSASKYDFNDDIYIFLERDILLEKLYFEENQENIEINLNNNKAQFVFFTKEDKEQLACFFKFFCKFHSVFDVFLVPPIINSSSSSELAGMEKLIENIEKQSFFFLKNYFFLYLFRFSNNYVIYDWYFTLVRFEKKKEAYPNFTKILISYYWAYKNDFHCGYLMIKMMNRFSLHQSWLSKINDNHFIYSDNKNDNLPSNLEFVKKICYPNSGQYNQETTKSPLTHHNLDEDIFFLKRRFFWLICLDLFFNFFLFAFLNCFAFFEKKKILIALNDHKTNKLQKKIKYPLYKHIFDVFLFFLFSYLFDFLIINLLLAIYYHTTKTPAPLFLRFCLSFFVFYIFYILYKKTKIYEWNKKERKRIFFHSTIRYVLLFLLKYCIRYFLPKFFCIFCKWFIENNDIFF